jgi:hypothetical protein
MEILGLLLVILALAFLVETLVEFLFGDILSRFAPSFSWTLKYIAVFACVGLAIFYKFDLPYLLGQFVDIEWIPLSDVSVPGMVVTGVAIGKGSNYLHDFLKKYFVKPTDTDIH